MDPLRYEDPHAQLRALYRSLLEQQENFDEFDYEDSTQTMLSDLIPTKEKAFRIVYEYDFGDSWNHEVLFEGRKPLEPEMK